MTCLTKPFLFWNVKLYLTSVSFAFGLRARACIGVHRWSYTIVWENVKITKVDTPPPPTPSILPSIEFTKHADSRDLASLVNER